MPVHPSREEVAKAVAILTGGRLAQVGAGVIQQARAETRAFRALSRGAQVRAAGATAGRGAKFVGRQAITKNPWGIAALLAYEGYIRREDIAEVAENVLGVAREAAAGERERMGPPGFQYLLPEVARQRKVSKANRAVKYGMSVLKAGTKASTGADKGKLPKGAFLTSVKAAGLANPKTKSVIGKGKSKIKALARKIKKWW